MTLHILHEPPQPELAQRLAELEKTFCYPLGPGRTFRISHGDDYSRFFRAMGEAVSLVVAEENRVLGTLGVALRKLLLPDGRSESVVYLGDLKVLPEARKSLVFFQLAWAAEKWVRNRANVGFGVVMDGTSATPDEYTGRVGIPAGRVLGKVLVWRIPCSDAAAIRPEAQFIADPDRVLSCYRRLSRSRYASVGSHPEVRSEMPLIWLLHPSGQACGLVEDTRKAKWLWADDGSEMQSAHLSYFAFSSLEAAVELLHAAMQQAALAHYPALFVSIADSDHAALDRAFQCPEVIVAPATIYGHGLDDDLAWNINTSEI